MQGADERGSAHADCEGGGGVVEMEGCGELGRGGGGERWRGGG